MDVITHFAKGIGNAVAKVKSNNLLIEELRKKYNPTFSEIMEILEVEDPTLATMLMLWYNKKYHFDELDPKVIEKEFGVNKKEVPKKKYITGGCGYTMYSNGGCGDDYSDDHC